MSTERIQIIITQNGAKAVRNDIEGLGKGADKASSSLGGLKTAITGLVASAAIRETIRLADSYTSMGNRIRTVTKSTDEFNTVQNELFRIAQRTRSPIEGITEGYSRLAISTQRMGLSQKETMQFTESLSQAIAIGGASAQEGSAAMRQLGQALGTGALKSDEFNSVMENAPVIMETIAKGMRVQVGDLKTLAGQGKITSQVIVDAFKEARFELEGRFGTAVTTASSAIGGPLMNSITNLVGKVDEATGATGGLAEAVVGLSTDIEKATPTVALLVKELTDLSEMRGPVDWFDDMLEGVTKLQFASLALMAVKEGMVAITNIPSKGFNQAFDEAGARYAKFTRELASVGAAKLGTNHGLPFNMIADSESQLGPLKPQIPTVSQSVAAKGEKGATFGSVLRDLEREHELLQMSNDERQIAQGLDRAREQLHGRLSGQQLAQLEYQLRENQLLEIANDSIERRLKDELAMMELEKAQQLETSLRLGSEVERGMNAASARGELGNAPDRSFEGASKAMGEEQLANMRTAGEEMAAIFGPGGTLEEGLGNIGHRMTDIIGYSIAFGDSWADTQKAVEYLGRSIVAEIISGMIRIPIQMAMNEGIASALRTKATTETMINNAKMASSAAPGAAAESLATGGANGIGAAIAISAASALALGLFATAAFEEGGYTGRGSRKRVAGVVHGDEFVLNSMATHRMGIDNLERINGGGAIAGGGKMNVYISNYAGGVEFETRQIDAETVEIIARKVLVQDGPEVIAADMRSHHGKTSRAMAETTTTRRRRA